MRVPIAGCMLACATVIAACRLATATVAAEPVAGAAPLVRVQRGDGTASSGRLLGIDAGEVRLAADAAGGAAVAVPVQGVRSVVREDAAAEGFHRILVTLVDGATLSGDEFAWDGKGPATLARPEGPIALPVGRVRSVAVLLPGAGATAAWQAAVPEGAASDLVVVGGEESQEFVECAITAVSPETVTVVLDDETIPVKRSKVIGMQWLRNDAAPSAGRLAVAVSGGGLKGDRVEWSADALVVDGEIRLPAAMLAGVDFASGRTVGLATLTAEKVSVEPWFGAFGRGVGLESFFAPRAVAARTSGGRREQAVAHDGLLMRPRTVATWRLPPDSRRLRATVAAAAGQQAADAAVVVVAVDDRELFRQPVDATSSSAESAVAAGGTLGIPLDIDLTGGRRLTVTVDFGVAGSIGGAVLFTDPVIER